MRDPVDDIASGNGNGNGNGERMEDGKKARNMDRDRLIDPSDLRQQLVCMKQQRTRTEPPTSVAEG